MKGDSEDLVKYRISRSLETLREADAMVQNGCGMHRSIEFIMLVIMQ